MIAGGGIQFAQTAKVAIADGGRCLDFHAGQSEGIALYDEVRFFAVFFPVVKKSVRRLLIFNLDLV